MRPTINDVAKKAGVSKTTVSRVLNGNYENVGQKTVEKVREIIKELGYRPSILAQGLKSTKTKVIGIVFSNLQNQFWMSLLEGAEDTCRKSEYNLMICNSNDDEEIEREHINVLLTHQVDGIIINPTIKNNAYLNLLISKDYPLVLINRKLEGVSDANAVLMDNIKGAQLATEHLLKLGNKIMLFVYTPNGISPRFDRIEGFRKAHTEMGVELDESSIQIIDEENDSIEQRVISIMELPERPDAIFSTNNAMSLEIISALKKINLKIPQEISLVSYDETIWAKHLETPLTTVSQPAYEMGMIAVNKLIENIHEKKREKETIILEPTLIIRESSGNNRGGIDK